jgi:hypothetical protein
VLSSGIAGTVTANGSGLQLETSATSPLGAHSARIDFISGGLFWVFRALF